MMTELILVEGVSDVQLISYYLQNVYMWKHEKKNNLGITPIDGHDHIESLSKDGNQLILCGVGGNGKFARFVEQHRINSMVIEREISSIMVVTDIAFRVGEWNSNDIKDSFGLQKQIDTYLLVVPADKKGALEDVIIDALKDIPEEKELIREVIRFIESLKAELLPDLKQINKANKATVGTFFSVRNPKQAMRSFASFVSKIDWHRSGSLNELFRPFELLGKKK